MPSPSAEGAARTWQPCSQQIPVAPRVASSVPPARARFDFPISKSKREKIPCFPASQDGKEELHQNRTLCWVGGIGTSSYVTPRSVRSQSHWSRRMQLAPGRLLRRACIGVGRPPQTIGTLRTLATSCGSDFRSRFTRSEPCGADTFRPYTHPHQQRRHQPRALYPKYKMIPALPET